MKKLLLTGILSTSLVGVGYASDVEERLKSLEEQNQQLIDEIAKLKEEISIPELQQQSFAGMGFAASKVYFSPQGLSIGGYGEIIYINYDSSSKRDYTDLYRFIPYIGYKFNDKIILNAEIEFEHGANAERGGEVAVEFAYIDFLINKWANIRLGNLLIPVGITNLQHEPIFFNSVNRPEVETKIIPTTWNENGILIYSNTGNIDYQIGIVNGLYGTTHGEFGFSSDSWIRGGRQGGAKAIAEDFAFVGRIDYSGIEGLYAGGSVYYGKSGQGERLGSEEIDGTVSIFEVHGRYQIRGFEITGLYVKGHLSDADKISLYNGDVIGKDAYGYYLNVSYDVMPFISKNSNFSLPIFTRYEKYNTQDSVADGFSADPNNDKNIWTVGLNFKPHANVVLKADYQFRDNEGDGEADRLELGLGFIF
jgi:hypothetical protein